MLDGTTKQILADVAAVVDRLGGGRAVEHSRHDLEMIALFDRCRGLLAAVRALTQLGFGHEALILTRPLFTESLMLLEVAAADEPRRVELVVGWLLGSLADLEGLMREAQARGDDTSGQLTGIAKQRADIDAYARRHSAGTRHWRVDVKALADKHRGGDGYLDFRMAHHFVHGSTFASEQRYTRRGEVALIGGPATEPGWAKSAALSAAQSMLFAVRGLCGIVDWPEPAELDRLLERVEQAGDE